MRLLPSKTSSDHALATLARYFGLFLFLVSFFLPAVSNFRGFTCAYFAIIYWPHDEQISPLALFGGWLNPQVLLFFFLSASRAARRLRAVLTITILFSIPMTWIAIHRMSQARMFMDLEIGHFLWIAGILFIVLPNLPSAFAFPFIRWLAGGAAMIVAAILVPPLIALTMHPASEMDDFCYVVAWTLEEPAVCGKINANAIGRDDQRDPTDFTYMDFTYMQSDCYRNVAAMLHAPQLCDNVKSASLDRLIGSLVAKSNCRKQNYTVGSAMPGTGPNFVGAMRSVGFGDEQLAEFLYQDGPNNYLLPILNTLRTDPAFLPRLHASPNYEEPSAPENHRDAHPLEFLDEMVAIQWDLPSLCQKISSNARPHNSIDSAGSVQTACYSHIAFNRRDDSLCRKLPPARNSQQTNGIDFLEGCMKNVAVLRNPNSNLQWVHYSPPFFPTWPEFQEAAQQLGYPATTPWLQLPRPTAEQYEYHLWYLAWPENGAARDAFVRRVLAIH